MKDKDCKNQVEKTGCLEYSCPFCLDVVELNDLQFGIPEIKISVEQDGFTIEDMMVDCWGDILNISIVDFCVMSNARQRKTLDQCVGKYFSVMINRCEETFRVNMALESSFEISIR